MSRRYTEHERETMREAAERWIAETLADAPPVSPERRARLARQLTPEPEPEPR